MLGARVEHWRAATARIGERDDARSASRERSETRTSRRRPRSRCQADDDWILKASLGRAVRMPTVAELYQGSIAANVIVNNDPEPEAREVLDRASSPPSATLTRQPARARCSTRTRATRCTRRPTSTVTPNVTNIQNVDEIRPAGSKLAFQAQRRPRSTGFDLVGSLTYADSASSRNDKFPGQRRQAAAARAAVARERCSRPTRSARSWSPTLGARYSGRQYSTLDNSDPNGFAFTGTSEFFVVDLRARYANERWSASLGIDNVGNEEYWAFHPYTQRSLMAELGVSF